MMKLKSRKAGELQANKPERDENRGANCEAVTNAA
jgi:hypothetical protein